MDENLPLKDTQSVDENLPLKDTQLEEKWDNSTDITNNFDGIMQGSQPAYNWADIKMIWDLLNNDILTLLSNNNFLYTLQATGKLDSFLEAGKDEGEVGNKKMFDTTISSLNETLEYISKAETILGTEIPWYDLTEVQERLINSKSPGAKGVNWSETVPQFAAMLAREEFQPGFSWTNVGIPLSMGLMFFGPWGFAIGLTIDLASTISDYYNASLKSSNIDIVNKASISPDSQLTSTTGSEVMSKANEDLTEQLMLTMMMVGGPKILKLKGSAGGVKGSAGVVKKAKSFSRISVFKESRYKKYARARLRSNLRRNIIKKLPPGMQKIIEKIAWEGHHIAPLEVIKETPLGRAAIQAGWEAHNTALWGTISPKNPLNGKLAKILQKILGPAHPGSHPIYSKQITKVMQDSFDDLIEAGKISGYNSIDDMLKTAAGKKAIRLHMDKNVHPQIKKIVENWKKKGSFN